MTDFNETCCYAVTEFLTLQNVQPEQIPNRMVVVYGEYVPSYAISSAGQLSFAQAEEAMKISPVGTSV